MIDHFGFGSLNGYRHATIKGKLPRYPDLRVAESDLRSGTIYSGPYEGYSDEEVAEVLDDIFVHPQWRHYQDYPSIGRGERDNLFTGKLLHFRALDERLQLPPGSVKQFLVEVVTTRYPAEVSGLSENTVRFALERGDAEWE